MKVFDYTKRRMHSLANGSRIEKCPTCGRHAIAFHWGGPRRGKDSAVVQATEYIHIEECEVVLGMFNSRRTRDGCNVRRPLTGAELREFIEKEIAQHEKVIIGHLAQAGREGEIVNQRRAELAAL